MRKVRLYEKIYKAPVYFITNCSQEAAKKWFRSFDGLEEVGEFQWGVAHTFARKFDNGNIIYGVWVKDLKNLETLAHEVFHLVNFVLNDRHVKFDPENDEAYAYLIEYFFKQFYI